VALANLDVIEREGLLGRAMEVGGHLLNGLRTLESLDVVGEVRGVGMMLAVELVADKQTREPLPDAEQMESVIMRETGVIVRNCAHSIVLSPPLVMSEAEADRVVEAIRSVLERTTPDGQIRG
jgi:adenosylmethionine-8-amino-7-oxononanoate aminotransferase